MALNMWTLSSVACSSSCGPVSAARAAAEPQPPPQPYRVTEADMLRMMILAQVAVRTDDRNLLQQMEIDARDPTHRFISLRGWQRTCSRGRRGSAHVHDRCAGSATSPYSGHHSRLRS